jgi:hypothetical protein
MLVLVALAVAAAGCTGGAEPTAHPTAERPGTSPAADPSRTFLGILSEVDQLRGWHHAPRDIALASGGQDSRFTIGPGLMRLSDGRRIPFGAGTPGGNSCVPLLTAADIHPVSGFDHLTRDQLRHVHGIHDPCVVLGERKADGSAAWFALRELDEGERLTRDADVSLGAGIAYDERTRVVTLRMGGAFVVARGTELSCSGAHGLSELIGRNIAHTLSISLRTKQVTSIGCILRD